MREDKQKGIVILGTGGHARVLLEALKLSGQTVVGFTDLEMKSDYIMGIPFLGGDDTVFSYQPHEILLVNGIGSVTVSDRRRNLFEKLVRRGYQFANVIHPSATISESLKLGKGSQIMAGAILQAGCCVGDNTIINTRAAVDHDSVIGDHVHLAPGVILSGGCIIGDSVHIGTGAIIIQGIKVGARSLIAAGSVVVRDIPCDAYVRGNPAVCVGEQ